MSALPLPPIYPPPEEPLKPGRNWKRVAAWIAAGVLAIVVLAVLAFTILLRSNSFHVYLLRTAEQKASAALGAQVRLQNFALRLSNLSLDLYGVSVRGAEPYPNPALLQVDHIGAGIRIVSVLHRKWYMNEIRVEHPVVNVFVDQRGTDNLPQTKQAGQKTSIFDLAIRHLLLDRGEIYYNNRKSALDADLHDLSLQSAFDTTERRYSGTLAYHDGHLRLGNFNPLPHDLNAPFSATPTKFTLDNAVLTSGQSNFSVTATVENYVQPRAQATYKAVVDATEFRKATHNPSLPLGFIQLAGSMQYQSQPNRPMVQLLIMEGDLSSRSLQVQAPSFRCVVDGIAAHYKIQNGNLETTGIRARLLGGELTGAMIMRDVAGPSAQSHLRAALHGISLADLKAIAAASSPSLRQIAVGGTVNASTDATWGKTFDNLAAKADATIQANVGPAPESGNTVPLNGVVHANYAAATKRISVSQSYLRTPQTSLTLNGTVGDRSNMQIRLQSNNLHELEDVANMFSTPKSGQAAQPLGLYGAALFVGTARGSTASPQLTGLLTAANLKVRGSDWRSLRTNVDVSPSVASLQNGDLQTANRGRITFNVSAGLRKWSFTETSPIQIALKASQLNVSDLAKAAGSQAPVTGTLSADISVHGSELNPIGQGSMNLTQAKISNEPVQLLKLKFQGTGDELHGDLVLQIPAGSTMSVFTYFPKQQAYEAQLQAIGIKLNQLETVKARNIQISGVLNVTASGKGTIKDPQLTATAQIPKLQVQDQTISGIALKTDVANHVANVALDSEAVNTYLRARGTVNLTGEYLASATLDSQVIPLQPLVAAYAPAQAANLAGKTELHATLRGPLKNKSLIDAHINIPVLQLSYKNAVQIGATNPIQIDYSNGVLTLQRATIRGTGTDLQVQGRIPASSTEPASLLALGTVDLKLAQLIDPDIASSGQLRFNINSYGARTDPNVQGQIEVVNATMAMGDLPIGLQNGNGVLTLTKDRLNITRFAGTVGGGNVTAQGGVVYRPSLQFDLALAGKGVRMLYPQGVRESVDTNLALTGTMQQAALSGQIRIDQLSFTPDFDLTNFIGQFSGETSPPPTQGFAQNLELNVGVQSTSAVNLVSRTLSVQGTANLEVHGTAAQPVIVGRTNLTGGDLIFMGNRYVLQSGTLDFVNPAQTQPVVNVAVSTTIDQYNINLRFDGPMEHLRTNYSSDPALPPSDIINLLAFGKTTEAAAAASASQPGNMGAQSLIASGVSNQITSRLQKAAGISQLSVDPTLGGGASGQNNPGARVTIKQRVTSNLFVTFATDVTSTQRQVIQLQYQFSPRVSVSGTRDQNGGFGVDTRIHKSW